MNGTRNYAQQALDAVAAELPGLDPELLRLYALLAVVQGPVTSLEDVHDAWALWRAETRPDHPAAIPFADLSVEVQELDRKYAEGIIRAAAKLRAQVTA